MQGQSGSLRHSQILVPQKCKVMYVYAHAVFVYAYIQPYNNEVYLQ